MRWHPRHGWHTPEEYRIWRAWRHRKTFAMVRLYRRHPIQFRIDLWLRKAIRWVDRT